MSSPREPHRDSWAGLLIPVALVLGLVLLLSLNPGAAEPTTAAENALEAGLKTVVSYLAGGAEIAAALVIGVAIVRALASFLVHLFRGALDVDPSESVRLRLGRALALGLEFTVASDILQTTVAPTRQDILNLAAIVLLRSLLNIFLEREIRQGEERRAREA